MLFAKLRSRAPPNPHECGRRRRARVPVAYMHRTPRPRLARLAACKTLAKALFCLRLNATWRPPNLELLPSCVNFLCVMWRASGTLNEAMAKRPSPAPPAGADKTVKMHPRTSPSLGGVCPAMASTHRPAAQATILGEGPGHGRDHVPPAQGRGKVRAGGSSGVQMAGGNVVHTSLGRARLPSAHRKIASRDAAAAVVPRQQSVSTGPPPRSLDALTFARFLVSYNGC